jgi:hypothetical protein
MRSLKSANTLTVETMVDVTGTGNGCSVGSDRPSFLLELMHPKGGCDREGNRCRGGRRFSGSLHEATREIAASLEPDGIAWLTAPGLSRAGLPAAVARAGLELKGAYLHFADSAGLKTIVPLQLLGSRDVAGMTGRNVRFRQIAASCLRVPGALQVLKALHPAVFFAVGRPGGPAPAEWLLTASGILVQSGSVLLRRSWHSRGSAVACLFQHPEILTAVAKIPGTPDSLARVERERGLLTGIAAGAAGWGVETPRVLPGSTPRPVLITGAIAGELAAGVLERRASEFGSLAGRLTEWLTGWNLSTRAEPLAGSLFRHLKEATDALEPRLAGGRGYFGRLHELVAREGQGIPSVASHGDLTMWNVTITASGLGILDWEEAEPDGVALADLNYALVDAAAACDCYRDRVAAFDSCFFGSRRKEIDALTGRLAQALHLKPAAVEICFHLGWLRHAANEVRREQPGPFLKIARRLASAGPRVK